MTYTVTTDFVDMLDSNKVYRVGDEYPRHGFAVSESRINALVSGNNAMGVPVIVEARKAAENAEKAVETKAEVKAPRTRRKTK